MKKRLGEGRRGGRTGKKEESSRNTSGEVILRMCAGERDATQKEGVGRGEREENEIE